ncbi:MAG TPA: UDP-N-acetylglucosamine--N-acetylmuramyl-(pentapeptide) pyrophosphoryl-undecaprenol N-acetylglucosamine transferase [Candidatus Paceibacterota bacterium]
MKILLTGGGSGGHFYPSIAVAEAINQLVDEKKIVGVKLYYMSDKRYDERALFENDITFKSATYGKVRNYFSILNFFDWIKIILGIITATWKMFWLFPDVVFGKGGGASFPPLFAARLLRIPVVIHESDAVPGKVNLWAAKFARRIAISYPEAEKYFPKDKTALTGIPIRVAVSRAVSNGAREFLKLDEDAPVILILGGSQGAQKINDAIVDILPTLVEKYYVLHQTGVKNLEATSRRAEVVLEKSSHANRYRPFAFLNASALSMAAGAATLVITRAGSTALTEIANWGLPAIVIPIPESVSRDQTQNALSYVRTGAGILIEEHNLTPHILSAEIEKIVGDEALRIKMKNATANFSRPDAARKIADELIHIALHQ